MEITKMDTKQLFLMFSTLICSAYCYTASSSNRHINGTKRTLHIDKHRGQSMWLAASTGNLKRLKFWIEQKKRNINEQDRKGRTPLHWAAGRGNNNVVQYLLTKDPLLVNIQDNDGCTALARAAGSGHYQIAQTLLKYKAKAFIADNGGKYPLHWAAGRCAKTTRLLLQACPTIIDKQDATGQTPLAWACGSNNVQAAKVLLEHGATPNIIDKKGQTPLHQAASIGSFKLVDLLIGYGAKIDVQCKEGKTPLQWAAVMGHYDMVRLLLINGADPNIQCFIKKRTALFWIIRMGEGSKQKKGKQIQAKTAQAIIEELLRFGAKTDIKDCFEKTPLQWAQDFNWKHEVYLMQHKNICQYVNTARENRLARPFEHLNTEDIKL